MGVLDDAKYIVDHSIDDALPQSACIDALENKDLGDSVVVVAVGKAAFSMADAVNKYLGSRVKHGVVITKYGHVKGKLDNFRCFEAGHPVLDQSSVEASQYVLDIIKNLDSNDCVLFLLSGGGSALFEVPLVPLEELQYINKQLLNCGASIEEINIIRKRLSMVKGGKFAKLVSPNKMYAVILSDVIGDRVDMIASGPCCADASTCLDALSIVDKYGLQLSERALLALNEETPSEVSDVDINVVGSVKQLCKSACKYASQLGYKPLLLTDCLECEASQAGKFLGCIAKSYSESLESVAIICGGETTVKITGNGLGGRNQEIALAAAAVIDGIDDCCIVSVGSDGTDGPTDAAGGIVTGDTNLQLTELGIDVQQVLLDNDSYNALEMVNALYVTGPTGTNVNDITLVLIKR